MRRKDREMDENFAYYVADKCEWATVAVTDEKGLPYCFTISPAREEGVLYFHSALAGKKVDCLKNNPDVCVSCVGDTNRLKDKFTTEYESAIIFGKAEEVNDEVEKIHALMLLCQRHTPENMGEFDAAIKESLRRTGVWKIKIQSITGKRKKYDKHGIEMKFGRTE